MSEREIIPVIIPVYEPDHKLIRLLTALKEANIEQIVLVDDGSGSKFQELFTKAKEISSCEILVHSVNMGKGRALKTAMNYCLQAYPEAIGCVTADSDGQHTPADILSCMQMLEHHPHSLILGCRDFKRQDVPARSAFGNRFTCKVFRYLVGLTISDTQTGLRGISAEYMKRLLTVDGERFEFETNMLIETKNAEIEIKEYPIQTIYIEENKTSHFRTIRDSARIYMVFGKFLFSALSSSVVDLLFFSLFCSLFRGNEFGGFSHIVLATFFARVISAGYNFMMNYKMVFRSKDSIRSAGLKYLALAAVQMSCSAFLVNGLYNLLGFQELFIKIPVDGFLFFISFFIQREFVYRKYNRKGA